MSVEVLIATFGVIFLWNAWLSLTSISNTQKISDLQKNTDVSDLAKEFEKFERRVMERLDKQDKDVLGFMRTYIDELKSIINDHKLGR